LRGARCPKCTAIVVFAGSNLFTLAPDGRSRSWSSKFQAPRPRLLVRCRDSSARRMANGQSRSDRAWKCWIVGSTRWTLPVARRCIPCNIVQLELLWPAHSRTDRSCGSPMDVNSAAPEFISRPLTKSIHWQHKQCYVYRFRSLRAPYRDKTDPRSPKEVEKVTSLVRDLPGLPG
jgi:hypothetical protein